MRTISENIQILNKQFNEYANLQYDLGYAEGKRGLEYSGRTFIGFHGWVAGKRSISNA